MQTFCLESVLVSTLVATDWCLVRFVDWTVPREMGVFGFSAGSITITEEQRVVLKRVKGDL